MDHYTYNGWQRRLYRRSFSKIGWALVIYYVLMNAVVIAAALLSRTPSSEGWGYIAATAIGLLILLIWKKPRFWKNEIFNQGKPMSFREFVCILCVFLSGQAVYQTVNIAAEMFLNGYGFTMMEGMEAMQVDTDVFTLFFYAGILAPIAEEIIFRGFVLRSLMPYGKKLAIFGSAFLFGIFHGNLLQSPYAFLVGLVLGYVAVEYSVLWAMVLHMINNLLISDMLNRLTSGMNEIAAGIVISGVVWAFTIGALVVFARKHRQIRSYLREEVLDKTCLKCFFGNGGVIVLMVLMGLSMIYTCFILITPL